MEMNFHNDDDHEKKDDCIINGITSSSSDIGVFSLSLKGA